MGIKDDFQVYLKPQSDLGEYGCIADNQEASSILTELQKNTIESEKYVLDIIVGSLSSITKVCLFYSLSFIFFCVFSSFPRLSWGRNYLHLINTIFLKLEEEDLSQQLSEGFMPDDTFMFGPQSMLNMDHIQKVAQSKGSPSFDGVCWFFVFVLDILLTIGFKVLFVVKHLFLLLEDIYDF